MVNNFKKLGDPLELKWRGGKNLTLHESLLRFFFLWPIMVPFLFWSFLEASLTKQFVIPFVTIQGIFMISDLLIFYSIGLPGFVRLLPNHRKGSIPFLPVSKNKYFVLIGIVSIIFFALIIEYSWIPNLPSEYKFTGPEYFTPIHIIALTGIVFLCLFYGICLAIFKTEIVFNNQNQTMVISGKTLFGEKFLYKFSLNSKESIQLALLGYLPTRKNSLAMTSIPYETKSYWGVFLIHGAETYLLFNASKKISLKFIIELSGILGVNYKEFKTSFYLKLKEKLSILQTNGNFNTN